MLKCAQDTLALQPDDEGDTGVVVMTRDRWWTVVEVMMSRDRWWAVVEVGRRMTYRGRGVEYRGNLVSETPRHLPFTLITAKMQVWW